jgi:hypothetical protein
MAWWRIICAIAAGITSHRSPSEALNSPRGEQSLFVTNVVKKTHNARSSEKEEFGELKHEKDSDNRRKLHAMILHEERTRGKQATVEIELGLGWW